MGPQAPTLHPGDTGYQPEMYLLGFSCGVVGLRLPSAYGCSTWMHL